MAVEILAAQSCYFHPLTVTDHLSTTLKWGNLVKGLSRRHNSYTSQACSPHPSNAKRRPGLRSNGAPVLMNFMEPLLASVKRNDLWLRLQTKPSLESCLVKLDNFGTWLMIKSFFSFFLSSCLLSYHETATVALKIGRIQTRLGAVGFLRFPFAT